ncbi:MAG: GntR family transcriptional regulator [Thermoanaerobaculia bacterium]
MNQASGLEILNLKSLREQVYDYLREAMNRGDLAPGATLDLNAISRRLGVSRTPLRDALLQLETEGFVTILPRRGCVVNLLTRDEIRDLYQLIGSLEASVIRNEFVRITTTVGSIMTGLNDEMAEGLRDDDFDHFYSANLELHECFLSLSPNHRLVDLVRTMKHRLYDFPRKKTFVKEWELRSIDEHAELIRLLEAGDAGAAADYIRDVHWSFEVQEPYIEQYYLKELGRTGQP